MVSGHQVCMEDLLGGHDGPWFACQALQRTGLSTPSGDILWEQADTWLYCIAEAPDLRRFTVPEFVKVGRSNDVETRLAQLQTGNPRDLSVWVKFPGTASLETELHRIFRDDRQRGEWFTVSATLFRTLLHLARMMLIRGDGKDSNLEASLRMTHLGLVAAQVQRAQTMEVSRDRC